MTQENQEYEVNGYDSESHEGLSQELSPIVDSVNRFSIYGNFDNGFQIASKNIHPRGGYKGYEWLGDMKQNDIESLLGDDAIKENLIFQLLNYSGSLTPEKRNKHIFAKYHTVDPDQEMVIASFYHEQTRDARGGSSLARMYFQMPKTSSDVLWKMIQHNPKSAEVFLRSAVPGYEFDGGNGKGIKRIASDSVALIDTEKINPDYLNLHLNPISNQPNDREYPEFYIIENRKKQLAEDIEKNKDDIYIVLPYGKNRLGNPILYGVAKPKNGW